MQYKVSKQELAGLKQNEDFSQNSILNLFEHTNSSYSFKETHMNDVLKNPDYVSQLMLVNNYTFFDMKLSSKEDKQVSVIADGNDFLVESPVDINEILVGVQMYTGNSILITSSLDVTLDKNDAYLFAVIIDFIRSKRSFLGNESCMFTKEEITSFVKSDLNEEFLLSSYLTAGTLGEFDNLENKHLITKHGSGYILSGEAISFSNSFTTIDNYIEVTAVANLTAGFTAIQSGLYTVLYFEEKGEQVYLQTISPGILIEIIEELIISNNKLIDIEQLDQTSLFCTSCGIKLESQSNFCGKCGNKI
jgi:hypothetical protein